MRRMEKKTVGILLFNEVEVLDFAGPFEVFSVTKDKHTKEHPFNVVTISENGKMIKARNGLQVQPDYSFSTHPTLDILIIPGGYGARKIEIDNVKLINWIREQDTFTDYTASVCTGAFLLAKAGLLVEKAATTHIDSLDRLERDFLNITVKRNMLFVDEGHVITSAGISAGIEMSLHLIGKILGEKVAEQTANHMEYYSYVNK